MPLGKDSVVITTTTTVIVVVTITTTTTFIIIIIVILIIVVITITIIHCGCCMVCVWALQDKSQNSSALKIPALTFLRTALESTDPSVWQKHLQVLAPAVFATVGERYYKVTAQGLRVTERLIFVIRPTTQAQMSGDSSVSFFQAWACHLLTAKHVFFL